MVKINPQLDVTELDDNVSHRQRAQDFLVGLPQPSMSTPNASSFATSGGTATHLDAANSTILDNMRTRINELENALVRAGIINSR